jgi:hypothetical protein
MSIFLDIDSNKVKYILKVYAKLVSNMAHATYGNIWSFMKFLRISIAYNSFLLISFKSCISISKWSWDIIFFTCRHNISCSTHQYYNLLFIVILLWWFVKFGCLNEVVWHIHVYCRGTWHSPILGVQLVFYLIISKTYE